MAEDSVEKVSEKAQKKEIVDKGKAREIVERLKAIMATDRKDDITELMTKMKGKGDVLDRMLEYYAMNKLISSMEGNKNDSDTFDSLMKYAIMRDALKPQIDMTQILLLMSQNQNRGSDDLAKALLQMQQMQMQQNQQLLTLMFGDRFRQFEEQVKQQREDFITYLQHLENRLASQPQSFTDELMRYKKFRELMLEFAESEGLTKEQVTNDKGQINWGALLNRIVKLGEKALTMKAQQPPAMSFNEIPTESVTTASPQEVSSSITRVPKGFTLPKVEEASPQEKTEMSSNLEKTEELASPQGEVYTEEKVVEGEIGQDNNTINNKSGDNEAGQGEAEESNTEQ